MTSDAIDAPDFPRLGDVEDAAASREQGLARLRAGDFAGAIERLGRASARDPADARTRLEYGVALQGARRHAEALEQFTAARSALPNELGPYLHAAFSHLALRDPAAALEAAEAACARAPKRPHAHFARGKALLDLLRPTEAEPAFAAALAESPDWADAWVQRAIARSRIGDVEGAKAALREALRHAPGHAAATANLAALEHPAAAPGAPNKKPAAASELRTWRPETPEAALGLAVAHLRKLPAFARLPFGEWSQVLIAQITRGHYYFIVDEDRRIRGFFGWALTNRNLAEEWVEGRSGLRNEDCVDGDCLIINAWASDSLAVTRFTLGLVRKYFADKQTVYYKRHYPDGHTRPVRLNVNEFVDDHLAASKRD